MADCFDLLGFAKRASLNEDDLHEAYAERSKVAHPDHGGNQKDAAELNAAYETLRLPDKRLKHLLELTAGDQAKVWRTVPLNEAMMNLFSQLGAAMEGSAKFLDKKSKAKSALALALLTNEAFLWREKLEEIGFAVEAQRLEMEAQLPLWDAEEAHDEASWMRLAAMQARFAYLAKWQGQVRERLLALM